VAEPEAEDEHDDDAMKETLPEPENAESGSLEMLAVESPRDTGRAVAAARGSELGIVLPPARLANLRRLSAAMESRNKKPRQDEPTPMSPSPQTGASVPNTAELQPPNMSYREEMVQARAASVHSFRAEQLTRSYSDDADGDGEAPLIEVLESQENTAADSQQSVIMVEESQDGQE
jgi:hypothetical protein